MCLIPSHFRLVFSCVFFCVLQFPNIYFANESDTIVQSIVFFFSFFSPLSLSFSLAHTCPIVDLRLDARACVYHFSLNCNWNQTYLIFFLCATATVFSYTDNSTQFVADGLTFTYSIQPDADGERSDNKHNPSNHRIVITSNRHLIDKKNNNVKNENRSTTASTTRTINNEQSNTNNNDVNNNDTKSKSNCSSNHNNQNNNNVNRANKIGNNNTTSKTSQTSTINQSMSSVNEVPTCTHLTHTHPYSLAAELTHTQTPIFVVVLIYVY